MYILEAQPKKTMSFVQSVQHPLLPPYSESYSCSNTSSRRPLSEKFSKNPDHKHLHHQVSH